MSYFHIFAKCMIIVFMASVVVKPQEFYNLPLMDLVQLAFNICHVNNGEVTESDITFYLSTRTNKGSPELISKYREDQVDVDKPSKFFVHGWLENRKVRWYGLLKDELLKNEDVNVIYVDYDRAAKSTYFKSSENCMIIGEYIAEFIIDKGFPPANLHLIGHSLGSHVAACAAKYYTKNTGYKMKRMTALDPAGPYFRVPSIPKDHLLSSDDAEIVDVIHTDGKELGLDRPLGTLDIYVNGGRRRQPGCEDGRFSFDYHKLLKNSLCSHQRSVAYFIESINDADLICRKCKSRQNALFNDCSDTDVYRIVHQNITEDMKGICAVSTGASSPYLYKN